MNYIFNENSIYDLDCDMCGEKGTLVMHADHVDYENAVADFITFEGATILEIGYGMGLSANQIQANNPTKHIIIEKHEQVCNARFDGINNKLNKLDTRLWGIYGVIIGVAVLEKFF